MLVLYEGLPGSGMTYAAVLDHLLPCVKSGRRVYTNIKGINHDRIAKLVENDSFVILDELQDFWPASNKPLKLFSLKGP